MLRIRLFITMQNSNYLRIQIIFKYSLNMNIKNIDCQTDKL